ncbi:UPF0182 family protein [Brevibacterium casei]|uniref:UPF0182 protein C272_01935 n=5 Tax=Actinomycetes TaxID=1760 RepID=K9B3T9_9MICO|nr:hypothetical protein C272_01935 [Brevibacterium casei S18]NJE68000.1 UPF0182 family protein [Brevibacterium sp. LS14]PAK95939.1 hypothetical protein B8X04_06680 [Brevibacterium casei]SII45063.1 Conserved transmembrane protein of uncharacterised function [Mycobacteroides abscessus subsp. abscessus]
MSTSSSPTSARMPGSGSKRSPLLLTLVTVAILLVAFIAFTQVYTEVLWFGQIGAGDVFRTMWFTRGITFLAGFVVMAVPVWLSLHLAYRNRPVYAPTTPRQENLDRYREAIEPLRRVATLAIPAVVGILSGITASAQWSTVLQWINATPFGETDPQFGIDKSFFVFVLPGLRLIGDTLGMALVLSLIAALVAHYLFGGIRPGEQRGIVLTKTAQWQIGITVAVLVLVQAGRLWLSRYDRLTATGGIVPGVTYVDDRAALPAMAIVAIAAVLVALLFVYTAWKGNWRISIIATLTLLVLGGVSIIAYPALVQQFQVNPSQQSLESEYIQRNIDATREAFDFDDIEVTPYEPSTSGEKGALREDAETAASIRLLDPNLVSDTFRQLQQVRPYYSFPAQLDVDRYNIDGQMRDTVIAVRELSPASVNNQSWYNRAIVYTHGFGVVAANGNQRNPDGEPTFMESDIPPQGEFPEYEPRVYFGESSPEYSIVGGPEGATPRELDYPSDEEGGSGQVNNTFQGDGGPSVGSLFNRLAYALKYQDEQILLSDAVNSESQILYERHPRQRVEKLAPFLKIDGDPYPAVVDGKIKWILDGYTTAKDYPYSTPQPLQEATEDSTTATAPGTVATLPDEEVNYIRNSVKITVDAYDGSVDMYQWDENDPVLKTWMKIFPGLIQPASEMSGDLMSHVRYPEDMFKVQRELLTRYHVTTASEFYTGQDFWALPTDPTKQANSGLTQPPFYMTLQMPGQEAPSFSLTSSYIPARSSEGQSRNNLTGFLSADADAGATKGEISENYGKLRLLQLPRNTTVPGPGQAQNNFNTAPEVQRSLNLLRQGESQVQNGNLLTLPLGGGLLYVQPVYVRSAGETSYPLLQHVLVAFGENIGFAPTLDEALDQVFGGDSGAEAGDAGTESGGGGTAGTSGGEGEGDQPANKSLNDALEEARKAMEDSDAALREGNFEEYGKAQDRLRKALEDAVAADPSIAEDGTQSPAPNEGGN